MKESIVPSHEGDRVMTVELLLDIRDLLMEVTDHLEMQEIRRRTRLARIARERYREQAFRED